MFNKVKFCIYFFLSTLILTSSFTLSAKEICERDVAGKYQFSGFSNSLDGAGTLGQPQSQAVVGQLVFNKDNTGMITFADLVVIINGQIVNLKRENVPFTYTLGPQNGYGVAVVQDFPSPGVNPTFSISFKKHKGKVVGFSQLVSENNLPTARWTLIQGERFN